MSLRSLAQDALREALCALERCETDGDVRVVLAVVHGASDELLARSCSGLVAEITPSLSRAQARLSSIRAGARRDAAFPSRPSRSGSGRADPEGAVR